MCGCGKGGHVSAASWAGVASVLRDGLERWLKETEAALPPPGYLQAGKRLLEQALREWADAKFSASPGSLQEKVSRIWECTHPNLKLALDLLPVGENLTREAAHSFSVDDARKTLETCLGCLKALTDGVPREQISHEHVALTRDFFRALQKSANADAYRELMDEHTKYH